MITLKYFSIWPHFLMIHKHLLRRKIHLVKKDEMFLSNTSKNIATLLSHNGASQFIAPNDEMP